MRRQNSVIGVFLALIMLTVLLASCVSRNATPTTSPPTTSPPGQTTKPAAPEKAGEIIIGSVGAYTGAYAPFGGPLRDSVRNAVKLYNDAGGISVGGQQYVIKIMEYDDRNDPKRSVAGVTMMRDLYDARMIIGPFNSQCTLAAQPVCESSQLLECSAAAADEAARPGLRWCWSFNAPVVSRAQAMVPYIAGVMKTNSLALISENEAFAISQRVAIKRELGKTTCQLVADETYESGTIDFSTVIARLRTKNPDVLWINGVASANILIVKQVYQTGWRVQLVGSQDLVTDQAFIAAGPALNGVVALGGLTYFGFVSDRIPESAVKIMGTDLTLFFKVADSFKESYGDKNMSLANFGYQWVSSFVECLKKAGTVDDAGILRDTYEGMEWQDSVQLSKILPCHRTRNFLGIAAFYQSDKGADNFKLLSIARHTDDYMENWVAEVVSGYPTVAEIRLERGY